MTVGSASETDESLQTGPIDWAQEPWFEDWLQLARGEAEEKEPSETA